ncbi:MAG: HNH endonuclease [Dehalococcoidia bacterium]|nr:MAG: HNH endonuclease [Dehalococcoidia bacterium]
MTLRRTALARRTQLRRTPMPRRKRELRAKTLTAAGGRRGTGPSTRTKQQVADRAGYCCEVCGLALHNGARWVEPHSFHHRRPRGAGGTSDPAANTAANLLLLCGSGVTGCHGRVERERTTAYAYGWLVHQGIDPGGVPVWVWWFADRPVLLTRDGHFEATATGAVDGSDEG